MSTKRTERTARQEDSCVRQYHSVYFHCETYGKSCQNVREVSGEPVLGAGFVCAV